MSSISYKIIKSKLQVDFTKTSTGKVFDSYTSYPNGDSWSTSEEVENWAKLYVAAFEDPNAPYAPDGPGIPGEAKPRQTFIDDFINTRNNEVNFGSTITK